MPKRALVTIGVDVDAVAGWLGSSALSFLSPPLHLADSLLSCRYGGEDSPNDISRGCFAAEVGVPRLLKLFDKYNLRTSWFIPGHSIDSFPKEMQAVRDAKQGHEIGLHGYSHENPIAMSLKHQKEVLDHTYDQLTELCGQPPVGCTAPWWENSREGIQLLLDKGIEYDHSSQAHDCQPFYTRDEDTWTKITYHSESAKDWMKPLVKGKLTPLVTVPAK